jgi:protein SCO1/2
MTRSSGCRIAVAAMLCLDLATPAMSIARFRLVEWPAAAPRPAFHLLDVDGHQRTSDDFRGRVGIVYFGFTHCPDVCPSELFKLALAAKRLGTAADNLRVIFVTLDPERDSPELLKAYVRSFDARIVGLTGSTADINAAAATFSVALSKVAIGKDYTIEHSTGVYVLDKSSHLRLVGTSATSIDDWVHDLAILLAE